jgi:hypothetical protein
MLTNQPASLYDHQFLAVRDCLFNNSRLRSISGGRLYLYRRVSMRHTAVAKDRCLQPHDVCM